MAEIRTKVVGSSIIKGTFKRIEVTGSNGKDRRGPFCSRVRS